VLAVALAAMLVTPAAWAGSTLAGYGGDRIGPVAGPTQTFASGLGARGFRGGGFPGGGFPGGGFRGGGRLGGGRLGGGGFAAGGGAGFRGGGPGDELVAFLKSQQGDATYAVAVSGSNAAGPYIMAGLSVLPLGGFTGEVPFPTVDQFREMVARGEVRYVLAGGRGPGGRSEVMTWVTANCTTTRSGALYDCAAG
jgi:hypothetical protein